MKNIIKKGLQGLLVVPVIALGISLATPVTQSVSAADCDTANLSATSGADCAQGNDQQSDLFGSEGVFRTITNVLLFIIGAVAVIMIIIGGLRYTISGGDSSAVTAAKNTILYGVVGVVVAILAYAVVNFVLGSFAPGA